LEERIFLLLHHVSFQTFSCPNRCQFNSSDDCVILGGTAEAHSWDMNVSEETAQRILIGNQRNVPALKGAKILSHHVGLRPGRSDVRLEADSLTFNGKKALVVHNYGHGGSGVTLFWGCAMDVVRIIAGSCEDMATSKI
ncbi:hypothetical protein OSTOST_03078, partial [Ostertagia ostertagi]